MNNNIGNLNPHSSSMKTEMSENEAIGIISRTLHHGNLTLALDTIMRLMPELQQYRSLGSIAQLTAMKAHCMDMSKSVIPLMKCPFCGGKAKEQEFIQNHHKFYNVYCGNCLCSTAEAQTKQMARETWNRRYCNQE